MLLLGNIKSKEHWPQAKLDITLSPLYQDKDFEFRTEATERIYEDGKLQDVRFNETKFYELVGLECIHGWSGEGVVDENGEPVECTPEAIKRFMKVPTASEFIMSKVQSLGLSLKKEVEDAKND
jgi:hypothetical protein